MTDDDRDREIGRAYRESRKLNQGIEGLKGKLRIPVELSIPWLQILMTLNH